MISLLIFALFPISILAATKTYDFNITWTTANPDGLFERKTIGINGKWPIPSIEVNKGDRVIVNMYNGLGDQDASLHFHGLFQNGTNSMDGPPGVTQCPVGPGQKFVYDFVVFHPFPESFQNFWRFEVLTPLVSHGIGRPARNLLVSFSRTRPIPRWTPWCVHCSR